MLFAVVNMARWLHVDAGRHCANQPKIQKRFASGEQVAELQENSDDLSFSEMDALWDRAKYNSNLMKS